MIIRRRTNVSDSYSIGPILLAYVRAVEKNDNPRVRFAIEKKWHGGGKWYLYKYDEVDIPMPEPDDLVPMLPADGPKDHDWWNEQNRRRAENDRRVQQLVDNEINPLLKQPFGS